MGLYASFKEGDRFAVLSSVFQKVHVHFVKDASGSPFVRCLAPGRCLFCEKKFKDWDRYGAFIYDYQEEGQFKIKSWTHQTEYLNKFFYSILMNKGLQSMDFIFHKKKGDKNSFTVIECLDSGVPKWYLESPHEVKKMWEDYNEDDIVSMMCRDLDYQGQVEFLKEVNAGPSESSSSSDPSSGKTSVVGDFLSGNVPAPTPEKSKTTKSPPKAQAARQEKLPITKKKNSSPPVLEEPKEFAMSFNGVPDDLM